MTGRLLLTGEIGLHRSHTGVDQQQRCVILGNQGKARKTEMALGFKETQVHLTQFVDTELFHGHYLQQ
jgi:hypothetical protein